MKKLFAFFIPVIFFFLSFGTAEAEADTWISEEAQDACIEIGKQYGICPELLMAIIEHESSGKADAVNGSCKGLMQVSEKWHKDRMMRLGVSDIYDTYGNILVATDYLAELFSENDDLYWVLMAYNGGIDYADRMYESEKYSRYAVSISARSAELEKIHGK